MQHVAQQLVPWLRKEWAFGVIIAVNCYNGSRALRRGRLSLRERGAVDWPAIEAVARCRTLLSSGLGQGRLHMRAVPADGSELVYWEHAFSTTGEAKHYAAELEGKTVAIHANPEKPDERIVCWAELRRMAPSFVLPGGGRLSAGAFRWVRAFQAAVLTGIVLVLTDVGLFATPWGRNAEWHGMCLCELSIGLLVGSGALLIPGSVLRRRIGAVSLDGDGARLRGVTRWINLVSVGAWAGLLFSAFFNRGDTPDAVVYGLITLPVFPLLWSSAVMAGRAERKLRPVEVHRREQPQAQIESQISEGAALVEAGGLR